MKFACDCPFFCMCKFENVGYNILKVAKFEAMNFFSEIIRDCR